MKITAIILNYNNYQDLKECLRSLETQNLPPATSLQILIIDNHSVDDSTIKIQTEFPQYTYIFNPDNHGFARGVNQGLKSFEADSDYFLLVNNDAILAPDCLKQLLAEMYDSVALAGPTIFYKKNPEIVWQAGGFFRLLKMGISVPLKNKKRPTSLEPQTVDFLSGCVLLISKNILKTIGLFDERFFFYGEDLDFCLRAKKIGSPARYVPVASAWHNLAPIPASRTSPFVLANLAKSYFLIIRKHFPIGLAYSLLLFIFIYTPFRLWQIVVGQNPLKNIRAWLKGGLAGLRTKL